MKDLPHDHFDVIAQFLRLDQPYQRQLADELGLVHPDDDANRTTASTWLLRARDKGVLDTLGKNVQEFREPKET